jgi:hypothetical protein
MVGDTPLGPFHIYGKGEIMPESPPYRLYASQLVNFQNAWYLLGTVGQDAESGISDPFPVTADETGIHIK